MSRSGVGQGGWGERRGPWDQFHGRPTGLSVGGIAGMQDPSLDHENGGSASIVPPKGGCVQLGVSAVEAEVVRQPEPAPSPGVTQHVAAVAAIRSIAEVVA